MGITLYVFICYNFLLVQLKKRTTIHHIFEIKHNTNILPEQQTLNLKIPTNFAHHGKNPQPITLNQTHFLVKNIPQNSKQINNKKKKNKTHLQPQSNWPYKIRTPNQYIYQIPQ